MFLQVLEVEYLGEYRLGVRFSDGREGVVDLVEHLEGGVFEVLRDVEMFGRVRLDEELGTVQWPNGVDFAPEFLYFLAFRGEEALQERFREWGYGEVRVGMEV